MTPVRTFTTLLAAVVVSVMVYTVAPQQTTPQRNTIGVPQTMAERYEEKIRWAVEPYMDPDEVTKQVVLEEIHPVADGKPVTQQETVYFSYPYMPAHDTEIRRRLGHPEETLQWMPQ